jgi:hypothetical protein
VALREPILPAGAWQQEQAVGQSRHVIMGRLINAAIGDVYDPEQREPREAEQRGN